MSGIKAVSMTLCYTCVAVSMITVLIPQKRTRRMMSFVVGLFFISTFMMAVSAQVSEIDLDPAQISEIPIPTYGEGIAEDTVAQLTGDNLTQALRELLVNEGIEPKDIQLTLKISDEGRISVVRAVIYISEKDITKTAQIKSIIYRNISKEPEIHVTGEEAHKMAE
ncbi:hypothetical protein [Ruminococcus sp.]|uniref:hypothetical protein n=1 Tax=Ruminococcus sp. TaxID=41978 RepID=UPI003866DFF4